MNCRGIDGTKPLGMTAKNGTPGGFFCVWVCVGWKWRKTRHSGLSAAFCGAVGCPGRVGWLSFARGHEKGGISVGLRARAGGMEAAGRQQWWQLMGDMVGVKAGVK